MANPLRLDANSPTGWSPETYVHVLDLTTRPPKPIGKVTTDRQPSGISFTPDGKLALVACRAAGTVTALKIDGQRVRPLQSIPVSKPEDSVSDVAIAPSGRMALVSVQKGGHLRALEIDGERVTAGAEKISAQGQPYRVVITPDGELCLTAGQGFAENNVDLDQLTIVDLTAKPARAIGYAPLGQVPESIELSPDGKLLAAVMMNGSHLPVGHSLRKPLGELVLLERRGKAFVEMQRLPTGPIPEGVAFTPSGEFLVTQAHPTRELWIFRRRGDGRWEDTGERVKTPGFPSALRAGKRPQ